MKPIKKPELLIVKKSVTSQPAVEEVVPVETVSADESIIHQQPDLEVESQLTEYVPFYAPVQDSPVLQSVGNTGWQVSDIWRDLRIDNFCD
ncbi:MULTISPECIES: hypothetical protein [unclassified Tolypothrix]|uniref:hypothetical protein n=1 Tax=unclassified Tolypothrix TaxID=2649714 RepID=UPI0005EAB9E5|nr:MULTISPECIES: hypothetical protein [unclassified Tolypothrix]BAY95248.1 hypothetical protein NIES3275_73050 [Microchaete diplosiphon NIES-3275]EKE98130.1 hypothetical protein FDUTEX481_04277 [Tolypothrix sp. PCC 7601]MBE9086003.1 hypothetical protein [Tolypothrix sp. LEGE 11397]UYD30474.1 hypothetical protein HGR01_37185 [Tolypothrix sp. PCC 7712]UYD38392.1 hypothetical protein HG267_37710 [Tolypothrix sp. PCC 7601]